jgi:TolB-like protein
LPHRRVGFGVAVLTSLVFAASVAAEQRVRVAILPIVIHSIGNDEYLRSGLGDMLASRIGRDPRLAVIQVADERARTTDPDAAREMARTAGADYVLYGSFTRFGEGASLDLQCASVLEARVGTREIFIQSGSLREIIPKLDPLAEKVVRYVAGTATSTAEPVSTVSTDGKAETPVDELRARVEALEKVIFAADAPVPPAREAEGGGEPLGPEGEVEGEGQGLDEVGDDGDGLEVEGMPPDRSAEDIR